MMRPRHPRRSPCRELGHSLQDVLVRVGTNLDVASLVIPETGLCWPISLRVNLLGEVDAECE